MRSIRGSSANWIDHISEAEPWLASLIGDPVYPIAVMVPALLALGFASGTSFATEKIGRPG